MEIFVDFDGLESNFLDVMQPTFTIFYTYLGQHDVA